MADGQYAVMTDRGTHRAVKLLSFEGELPMGSILKRMYKAVDSRVRHEFRISAALDGVECPNFHVFMGLHLVDIGVMTRVEFEAIVRNPGLHDIFLTAFELKNNKKNS